jgi:hypothetical protein
MAANRAVTRATGGRWAQRRGVIRTGLKRHVRPGLVQVERTDRAVRLSWRGRHWAACSCGGSRRHGGGDWGGVTDVWDRTAVQEGGHWCVGCGLMRGCVSAVAAGWLVGPDKRKNRIFFNYFFIHTEMIPCLGKIARVVRKIWNVSWR